MIAEAAPLLLSGVWTNQNPAGYWVSEKLDGVRGYWDGARLMSRNANPIHAPDWFLAALPADIALDGELWCGRGRYGEAMGACKSATHPAWSEMRFMAFDLPHHPDAFEVRQRALMGLQLGSVVTVVSQTLCAGLRHMRQLLREVAANRGEGLMLRESGSYYVPERSRTLLKVRVANNTELL